MSERIDRFYEENPNGNMTHTFLSNFYMHDGWSVEHYYQAAKTDDPGWTARVLAAKTPGLAKKIAYEKGFPVRKDWFDVNLAVMKTLLRIKFMRGSMVAMALLATGDAELIEGNFWHDEFWGMDDRTWRGENHLGRQLMEVREELRCG